MCVLHDALCQDSFLVDQRHSDSRSEAAILDVINPVQRLYNKVLQFISSDDGFHGGGEALDDGGEDGDFDGVPGGVGVRVLFPGSANLVDKRQGPDHLGEALVAF